MVLRVATNSASYSSLFYLSNPISAALTRRSFQFLFAFMSCFLFLAAALDVHTALQNGVHTSRILRFKTIQARNGLNPQSAHVSSFGVMLNNKAVVGNLIVEGPVMRITFAEPTAWNMWYFRTSAHSPEWDPVRFCLEEYDPDGDRWRTVGSS
jgi:hypothetical protein